MQTVINDELRETRGRRKKKYIYIPVPIFLQQRLWWHGNHTQHTTARRTREAHTTEMTASNVTAMMSTPPRSSVGGGGGGAGGGAPPMSLASPPLLFSACQPSPSSEQVIPATPDEEGTKKPADDEGEAEEWVGGSRGVATTDGAAASRPVERVAMRCGDEASRIIYRLSRVVYSLRSRTPNKINGGKRFCFQKVK